jgi:uncharacterized protein YjbI with pentapeptide repeats
MEAALEISFYVLGVVFALGVLMVLVLVKDVFFHGRFNTILPAVKRVPTTALDAARAALQALRQAALTAQGERREAIGYELRHLEHRIAALEDKTYADQSEYYDTAKARERTWREWRALHQQLDHAAFRERRQLRDRVDELRQTYRKLDREVNDEYHRAVARDALTLEELHTQGVLAPEVLRVPEPPPTETQAAGQPGAGQTGAGQPEAGVEGAAGAAPTAAQRPRSARWMSPLPPYAPAQGGVLAQADLARPEATKTERTYVEPTLSTARLPGGMLAGADLSRSSFAEVEAVGALRFLRCTLVATDLRRMELKRGEGVHVFQDCDLRGSSLAQAHLAGVVFRRCDLSGTHWRNARLDGVRFDQCRVEDVHWDGADLSRSVMSEDMLGQADFTFATKPPLNLRSTEPAPPELRETASPPAGRPPAVAPARPAGGAQFAAPAPQAGPATPATAPPTARDTAAPPEGRDAAVPPTAQDAAVPPEEEGPEPVPPAPPPAGGQDERQD